MLTGRHIAILGGDARQLEVIRKFSEMDASVTLIGFDNLQHQFAGVQKSEPTRSLFKTVDALILPAVVTDGKGKLESIFSSREIILDASILEPLSGRAKVYTGYAKSSIRDLCRQHNVELIELFDRNDVAIYNSIPTAEGAVMMAMENTDFTIHGSQAMVLGLGRTGLTLARTLQGLGAKVKTGVRRDEQIARAIEMNFEPFYIRDLIHHVSHVDLLFNTVPSMVVTAKVLAKMSHRALIIDLASKPGGTDFRFAEKRGMKALLAPGLPGIVAPKTAGQIMANCLFQLISEDLDDKFNGGMKNELER